MRIEIDTASSFILQQTLTGSGVFNGTEVGRAKAVFGAGSSQVRFRAKYLGADGNALKVTLVDPGRDAPSTTALYDVNSATLAVVLKKTGGVLAATAQDVADAVLALRTKSPICCSAGGAGLVAAQASTSLAGGLDPTILRNVHHKFAPASGANGGLFYFEQSSNVILRQVELKFSSSVAYTVSLVNLDEGLEEITSETVLWQGATAQSVVEADAQIALSPLRGIRIDAAAQGVARVICHREPVYPY